MTVKIVTDSCSDITQQEARKLGITVVPAYVHFGTLVYRDGVDIECDEFYKKLALSSVHPSTATPSPGEFASVYDDVSKETSEIVSIHVTRKHSGMYDSALVAKGMVSEKGIKIAVIDSRGITMWQGLTVIAAANAARLGCSLQTVIETAQATINQLHALAFLDTLRYAVKGGRLSNTIFALESKLSLKTFITLVNGEIRPVGATRSRRKAVERIRDFVSKSKFAEISIVHSNSAADAQVLADYYRKLFPDVLPRIDKLGPVLGVHAGPGALAIIARTAGDAKAC